MRFHRGKRYTYYSSYSSSRKSRIRWDRIAIITAGVALILAALIVVVVGIVIWFNLSRIKLMFKGYSFGQQNDILSLSGDEVDEVLSHDKMEHIQDWIKESEEVKYYDEYEHYLSLHKDLKVKAVVTTVNDIFNNYANQLKALSYTDNQIWEVLKTARIDDLKYLINKSYKYAQVQPYMQVKGFVFTDMDKYMKVYEDKKNYNYAVLSTTYPFIISKNKATKIYTIQDPKEREEFEKEVKQLLDNHSEVIIFKGFTDEYVKVQMKEKNSKFDTLSFNPTFSIPINRDTINEIKKMINDNK